MRALLLYNPTATTTNLRVRDTIAHRLSEASDLEVAPTKQRDHASYLAAGAAHEGIDVVVVLGGDGTVNEAIQGLARTETALAIIPGGSTNVWARSLGLPNDPEAATEQVVALLERGQRRTVNLGTANGRYFCFSAGYGFDAAAVREVERRHRLKHTVRQASFLWGGLVALLRRYDPRGTDITVHTSAGAAMTGCKAAVCCNSRPYTFLGPWAADLCPGADLDADLDVTALTQLSVPVLLRLMRTALGGGDVAKLAGTHLWHDEAEVTLTSAEPLPLQVDGDYVGDDTTVRLSSARRVLQVVAATSTSAGARGDPKR